MYGYFNVFAEGIKRKSNNHCVDIIKNDVAYLGISSKYFELKLKY